MKHSILFIVIILLFTVSCKNTKNTKNTKKIKIEEKLDVETSVEIPFLGTWSRSFALGKDSNATVNYKVFKDSIQYEMLGAMAVKYTLIKDTFVSKDNRWIGKRNETPYVIFIKNISKDSISLLKMKVESNSKALTMPFPSDTARSKFSSWNTFKKK